MKRILFVDDEPQILDGLRRMLRCKRQEWEMAFVESGQAALAELAKASFDVVVTDMRMPAMDGAELLERIRHAYPRAVRIVLSGHSEKEKIMRSVRPAHQYLVKPIEQQELLSVLQKALDLQKVIGNESLLEILGKTESLPAVPAVYAQLMEAIESEDASMETIGKIVGQDLGMTATVLKVVNSAFFGLPRAVSSVAQAVGLLGLDLIRSLVLSYQLFTSFEAKGPISFSLQGLWRHSAVTASFAKRIAQMEGADRSTLDDAFMAGVLHDVGKLPLFFYARQSYEDILGSVRAGEGLLFEVEERALGTSHAEAGAFLMGLWGMSDTVVRAIAFHHRPANWPHDGFGVLTAVHAANVLEHGLCVINKDYRRPQMDLEHLEAVGKGGRVEAWTKECQQLLGDGACFER